MLLSAGVPCLIEHRDALRAAGAERVGLSPQASGFMQVIDDFDAVLNHGQPTNERIARWAHAGVPQPLVAGYAFGAPGMALALSETASVSA